MNNKGADQTARMCRLSCAFVVHIGQKQVFSWQGLFGHGEGTSVLRQPSRDPWIARPVCTTAAPELIWMKQLLTTLTTQSSDIWAPSSEFVSSGIPSWQILTAHAQPFRGTRDLAFCLKVPLDSLLVWASSEGSGETVWMRRLAWTFAARIGNKYQIRLTWSICCHIGTQHRI